MPHQSVSLSSPIDPGIGLSPRRPCLHTRKSITAPGEQLIAQLSKSNHTRLAHACVTLSGAKGLKPRFFAPLRMTLWAGHMVKRTNVMGPALAPVILWFVKLGCFPLPRPVGALGAKGSRCAWEGCQVPELLLHPPPSRGHATTRLRSLTGSARRRCPHPLLLVS